MKRIIEEVLQAEERVNTSLQEARTRAAAIRTAADREATAKIAEAKDEARRIVQAAVEQAKRDAEVERRERLDAAEATARNLLAAQAETVDAVVDQIVKQVLGSTGQGAS